MMLTSSYVIISHMHHFTQKRKSYTRDVPCTLEMSHIVWNMFSLLRISILSICTLSSSPPLFTDPSAHTFLLQGICANKMIHTFLGFLQIHMILVYIHITLLSIHIL